MNAYSNIAKIDWSKPPFGDDGERVEPPVVHSGDASARFQIDENIFAELNSEAANALRAMVRGSNVFLTGGAGTGKSYVLRTYIREARRNGVNIVVAAPTGIAANNLGDGATTIHRAFGIPLADCYYKTENGYEASGRDGVRELRPSRAILNADVVVVDEISMCRLDLFSALVWLLGRNRGRTQLIVCGDFYQLPPVVRPKDVSVLRQLYPSFREGFAFETEAWDECEFETHVLRKPMRQLDDTLVENLELARHGISSCLRYFNKRACLEPTVAGDALIGRNGMEVIHLVPTNREADEINNRRMNDLCSPMRIYRASEYGRVGKADKPAPEILFLKPGMRVMTVANHIDNAYSNGSLGTVVDFDVAHPDANVLFDGTADIRKPRLANVAQHRWEVTKPKVVAYDDGSTRVVSEKIGEYSQLPLRHAYAITIHKSQGQTLDEVRISPRCFAPGQAYVALSRLTNLDGLYLDAPIPESALFSSNNVRDFYKRIGVE